MTALVSHARRTKPDLVDSAGQPVLLPYFNVRRASPSRLRCLVQAGAAGHGAGTRARRGGGDSVRLMALPPRPGDSPPPGDRFRQMKKTESVSGILTPIGNKSSQIPAREIRARPLCPNLWTGRLQSRRISESLSRLERFMRRVLLSSVATVVLCTAMAGCKSDSNRAMAYCQENYSGYTQSECERQFRNRYSGIGHSKASERRPQ